MSEYIPKNNLDSNMESNLDLEDSIDNKELNNISKNENESEKSDLQNNAKKEIEFKIEAVRTNNEDRDYYALATIYYLKKDLDELENIYSKMTQDENSLIFCNTKIVERFIKGLKERGDIDYKKDYFSIE